MSLTEIYHPIKKELADIERLIRTSVAASANPSIVAMSDYLMGSGGKRLRPALVMLSVRAANGHRGQAQVISQAIRIGSAIEVVHLASLIHDDVVDHALIRHNKPTVNSKWGDDMALILGDYLYSIGFDLISSCGNPRILTCLSRATRLMCEGELIQVCERDNLDLLKERYFTIIRNKTANLFAASCEAAVLTLDRGTPAQRMLRDYGMNFGIAFQIVDDALDLIGDRQTLGKTPGADFKMGEMTLPLIHLLAELNHKGTRLIAHKNSARAFRQTRRAFKESSALARTRQDVGSYAAKAKESLIGLHESPFKRSLLALADYVVDRMPA